MLLSRVVVALLVVCRVCVGDCCFDVGGLLLSLSTSVDVCRLWLFAGVVAFLFDVACDCSLLMVVGRVVRCCRLLFSFVLIVVHCCRCASFVVYGVLW